MQVDVKAVMSGDPVSIEPGASALAALDLMAAHAIRHLPVAESDGRVIGVVSLDDLRAAFPVPISLQRPPSADERPGLQEIAVGEVMTWGPVTISADDDLADAARRMVERRIGCRPVLDEAGALAGIVTETDLLEALVTMLWTDRLREDRFVASLREEREVVAKEVALRDERGARSEHAARRLAGLDDALARSAAGTLRRCTRCGGSIGENRLRALPASTLCVACAGGELS